MWTDRTFTISGKDHTLINTIKIRNRLKAYSQVFQAKQKQTWSRDLFSIFHAHYQIGNFVSRESVMSKILVVEDSISQREMISELLKGSGLKVDVAGDGVEALETLSKLAKTAPGELPDLIVLDIVMPRMNGYELCRRIKSDPKTQDVPVVMCSSKGEEFDRYWGMKQGADAYIAKPFQPAELIGTIKQLLRG